MEQIKSVLGPIVTATTIQLSDKKFIAKDNFKVGDNGDGVKISHLGNNFKEWFLGKEEEPISGRTVYSCLLNSSSSDKLILTELQGERRAAVCLAEIFALIRRRPLDTCVLLDGCRPNIFHAFDENGIIRAVDVFSPDGKIWGISSFAVEEAGLFNSDEWSASGKVFFTSASVSVPFG